MRMKHLKLKKDENSKVIKFLFCVVVGGVVAGICYRLWLWEPVKLPEIILRAFLVLAFFFMTSFSLLIPVWEITSNSAIDRVVQLSYKILVIVLTIILLA